MEIFSVKDLVKALAEKRNISQVEATEIVGDVFDLILENVKEDKKVKTPLGHFERKLNAARQGRNPQTDDTIEIPAYNSLKFKPSASVKESIK